MVMELSATANVLKIGGVSEGMVMQPKKSSKLG